MDGGAVVGGGGESEVDAGDAVVSAEGEVELESGDVDFGGDDLERGRPDADLEWGGVVGSGERGGQHHDGGQ